MTIDRHAPAPATARPDDELVEFVFRPAAASGLLKNARAMLAAAPRELAASFEQAVRGAELAS